MANKADFSFFLYTQSSTYMYLLCIVMLLCSVLHMHTVEICKVIVSCNCTVETFNVNKEWWWWYEWVRSKKNSLILVEIYICTYNVNGANIAKKIEGMIFQLKFGVGQILENGRVFGFKFQIASPRLFLTSYRRFLWNCLWQRIIKGKRRRKDQNHD